MQSTGLVGTRDRARELVVPVTVGLLAGVLAKLGDLAPGPWGVLGSSLGPWVALVVLVAVRAGDRVAAAVGAGAALLASLVGYYVTYRILDGTVDLLVVAFWLAAALTAVPLLAVGVRAAMDGGPRGPVGAALVVGLLVAEGARAVGLSRWPVVVVDAALAAFFLWLVRPRVAAQIHGPGFRRRMLALLPLFVVAGLALLAAPRFVLGVLIGGG